MTSYDPSFYRGEYPAAHVIAAMILGVAITLGLAFTLVYLLTNLMVPGAAAIAVVLPPLVAGQYLDSKRGEPMSPRLRWSAVAWYMGTLALLWLVLLPTDGRWKQGPWTHVLYACAATLHRMVTGRVPVDAASRLTGEPLPRAREFEPAVSRRLDRPLERTMALDPGDRLQAARELIDFEYRIECGVASHYQRFADGVNRSLAFAPRGLTVGQSSPACVQ